MRVPSQPRRTDRPWSGHHVEPWPPPFVAAPDSRPAEVVEPAADARRGAIVRRVVGDQCACRGRAGCPSTRPSHSTTVAAVGIHLHQVEPARGRILREGPRDGLQRNAAPTDHTSAFGAVVGQVFPVEQHRQAPGGRIDGEPRATGAVVADSAHARAALGHHRPRPRHGRCRSSSRTARTGRPAALSRDVDDHGAHSVHATRARTRAGRCGDRPRRRRSASTWKTGPMFVVVGCDRGHRRLQDRRARPTAGEGGARRARRPHRRRPAFRRTAHVGGDQPQPGDDVGARRRGPGPPRRTRPGGRPGDRRARHGEHARLDDRRARVRPPRDDAARDDRARRGRPGDAHRDVAPPATAHNVDVLRARGVARRGTRGRRAHRRRQRPRTHVGAGGDRRRRARPRGRPRDLAVSRCSSARRHPRNDRPGAVPRQPVERTAGRRDRARRRGSRCDRDPRRPRTSTATSAPIRASR